MKRVTYFAIFSLCSFQLNILSGFQPSPRRTRCQPQFFFVLDNKKITNLAYKTSFIRAFIKRSAAMTPFAVFFSVSVNIRIQTGNEIIIQTSYGSWYFPPLEINTNRVYEVSLKYHSTTAKPILIIHPSMNIEIK